MESCPVRMPQQLLAPIVSVLERNDFQACEKWPIWHPQIKNSIQRLVIGSLTTLTERTLPGMSSLSDSQGPGSLAWLQFLVASIASSSKALGRKERRS
ncbi:uncharacterized protein PAC_16728 [Phialocephala subalpina]|uniref:Uncharacterized protein n=1 Tax=Phialocephala subalpina TaxID=576137 RepID=A0A1L7XPD0_9HELO|nr:uncharacterized protein PAC_16728 [Phialocephala subalpina]